MKKILIITLSLVLMVIFSFPMSFAGDYRGYYTVKIEIIYETISLEDARKLAQEILQRHRVARDVVVTVDKQWGEETTHNKVEFPDK